MGFSAYHPATPTVRLLRRAALFLCVCFPLWALYLLLFELRSPYGGDGRAGQLVTLQNVEQMLRENLQDQARHAEFREGAEAREERILKMRGVFDACVQDLKKEGDGNEDWVARLERGVELARRGGKEAERESAELEMRVAGAVVLGEIGQHVARMENPPYEAFEAQRRQLIVILLIALVVVLFPLAYLGHEEWREHVAAVESPQVVTAAPWMEEAFQRFPEAVMALDEGLRVRWANSAAERMLGYKPREMEGVSATAILPEMEQNGLRMPLAVTGGKLTQTARRRGGEAFEATFQVVRAGARTLVLLREEAKEKPAGPKLVDMQALREERDYFGDLLRAAPTPLMVLNRDGHIIRFNRAAEELLEYSAAEVMGSPYWDVFLGEGERRHAEERWEDLKHEKGRQAVEESWKPRMQGELMLRWQREVLLDGNGQVKNVVAAAEPVMVAMTAGAAMGAAAGVGAGEVDLSFDEGEVVAGPVRFVPVMGGSMEALEDRLTEVIGYAELALMAMPEALDSRVDVERVKSAAEEAIGLLAGAREERG